MSKWVAIATIIIAIPLILIDVGVLYVLFCEWRDRRNGK